MGHLSRPVCTGTGSRPGTIPGSSRARRADELIRLRALTPHQTKETHMAVRTEKSADATAIRPLTGETPQADLDDLRARIAATRWPEKETVEDLSQGPRVATMQALADYLATDYDWRRCEAQLDA